MILVTGHEGFIGKNLVKRLEPGSWIGIEKRDTPYLNDINWPSIEQVYHLGAISDTTCTDLGEIMYYNVTFTEILFRYCVNHNIPCKYASSASVYGGLLASINPLNQYALSKAMIDQYVIDNQFKTIRGYRFFNVYGEGEEHKGDQSSPIHKFVKQAKGTGVIKIFEGSEFVQRDFIWVEDALDCLMYNGGTPQIVDVGTGNPISFREVAELIAQKYDARVEHIPFPDKLRGRYQYCTRSKAVWNKRFITVGEYLERDL